MEVGPSASIAPSSSAPPLLYRSLGEEDKSHDYNPEWDYEVDDDVPLEISHHLRTVSAQIYGELRSLGIIDSWMFGFEVWAAHLAPNAVAMYISGTYDWPVVLLDIPKHGGNLDELTKSIRHELKHAIQESKEKPFDEGEAEADGPFLP